MIAASINFLPVPKGQSQRAPESLPSKEEYQHFAEEFADLVLDPRQPWLPRYIQLFGFPPVPTEAQISTGALAAKMRRAVEGAASVPVRIWVYVGLTKHRRNRLVDGLREEAKRRRLQKDDLSRLLAWGSFKTLKRSLKGLAEPFKFRPGPTPPTKRQYDQALRYANMLVPALLKLDKQMSVGTSHSLKQNLKYLSKDSSEACQFLLKNIALLRKCLDEPKVLARGKTRPNARARALADAIAGSIYLKRKVSTSIKYLGDERRRRQAASR